METFVRHSLKGKLHLVNEDSILVVKNKNYHLFYVFDGVSSSEFSMDAIKLTKEYILKNHKSYFEKEGLDLGELMYNANKYIVQKFNNTALTTFCAIHWNSSSRNVIAFSNLGDSRIYEISNQYMNMLSTDDTILPGSNILTKSLGMSNLARSDFRVYTRDISSKRFLLCTDGFYHFLEDNRILFFDILNGQNPVKIKEKIREVLIRRNKDDATYLLLV